MCTKVLLIVLLVIYWCFVGSQARMRGPSQESQLFEDTSHQSQGTYNPGMTMQPSGYNMPPGSFPGQNLINDPMANMAMQYGQSLAGHGKEILEKNVSLFRHIVNISLWFIFLVSLCEYCKNFCTRN